MLLVGNVTRPALRITLPDIQATEQLAQHLAPSLKSSDVIALYGDLGAGKTTLARALIHALGVTGDVPSPTFTLLQTYDAPLFTLTHFDLYRLKSADELDELGWDDALASGVVLVEWPERAGGRLPHDYLELHIGQDATGRFCTLTPHGTFTGRTFL